MDEKQFSGKVSEMRDSPWLASEDLEDANSSGYVEATVTIDRVMEITDAQFKGGRSKKKCYAIQFVGKARMLVLNGVNRETLKEMWGRKATDWIGKQIVLYVKPDVLLMGKKVPGIRIRPAAVEPVGRAADGRADGPSISPEDEAFIAECRGEIERAESTEVLKIIGSLLKTKSKAVQDTVRPAYVAR